MKATIHMLTIEEDSFATQLEYAGYRSIGFTITSASHWKEAQDHLENLGEDLDLILVNLDSLSYDGFSLIRKIRGVDASIPIVATSVQNSPLLQKEALYMGASLFLEQPIPRDSFLHRVRVLLEQERRNAPRVDGDGGIVQIVFEGQSSLLPVLNLSVSGIFAQIKGPQPWLVEAGRSTVRLLLRLPGLSPMSLEGEVVRVECARQGIPGGIGIQFKRMPEESKHRLDTWMMENNWENKGPGYYH